MSRFDWRLFLRDAPVFEMPRRAKGPKRKGKGNPKYSPGLMTLLGTAERRLVGGFAKGVSEYAKRSRQAAAKGTDGALRAAPRNLVRAQEKAVQQVAKVPRDLIKGREFRRGSKGARRITRLLAW